MASRAEPVDTGGRRDWRDVARDAADLALLGILLTLAAVPLLTAAAAAGTASAAVHDWTRTGSWPSARTTVRRFGRAVLPGVPVSLLALAGAALLVADLAALATGRVPGGTAALLVTALIAAGLAGYAGLVVVEVGGNGGGQWRASARSAARACLDAPTRWAALTGVVALAGLLTVLVTPVAVPILAGYTVAALHAVTVRRPVPVAVARREMP
ncbi:hypothetical protein AB0J94_19575 [Micromonospora noduli]|uniref:Membrane protein YesL n=1 Tax=Micromonospora noduli TaxID=709876 RepID=A0ABX9D7R8_9ACTN|nr:hypothetical protein [Micromonospora noduli]RAO07140.1 hypothetical protein LUPAC07_06532 [Micromonospora noduli]RAO07787.1 hypothetical protein GUI43_04242 [Micromonospora noduli]RAO24339.1 hypothetical protein MED15_00097 [Micromonospora noduli]